MGSSSSSQSNPRNRVILIFLFVFFLLRASPVSASRVLLPSSSSSTKDCRDCGERSRSSITLHPQKMETGFVARGRVFNFFPKGVPIPPSGPSKRHNSFVDSVSPQQIESP